MPSAVVRTLLTALPLLPILAPAGLAASFSVVGKVSGGPQIGAYKAGTLYGTVAYSTPPVFFSLSTAGAYKVLHSFNTGTDGGTPNAMLAIDKAGNIFGTASTGGSTGGGTLFEFSAAQAFSVPHTFGSGNDGVNPRQGPTMGPGHTLYGSTAMGAPNANGVVFKMAESGAYDVLYNFQSQGDGHCPFSGVAVGADGTVYGTTVGVGYGGNPNGSVWKYTSAGGLKTLYVFQDGADGEWPDQAPTVDSAGNLYGTTHVQNGTSFAGAIWKISASGKFSVLHSLSGSTDGYSPNSPLLLDKNGKLYGTTGTGGNRNYGTVFEITPSGQFTVLHSFTAGTDGAQPTGNLVRGEGKAIYGGTAYGPVFKIVP